MQAEQVPLTREDNIVALVRDEQRTCRTRPQSRSTHGVPAGEFLHLLLITTEESSSLSRM